MTRHPSQGSRTATHGFHIATAKNAEVREEIPMLSRTDLYAKLSNVIHRRNNRTPSPTPCESLWATPETLFSIRDKKELGEPLTRDEWQIVAYYVQIGSEYPRWHSTSQPELLRAFRAAFEIRDHRKSRGTYLPYYMRNLPDQCQARGLCYEATPEMVREVIVATFEELACNPDGYLWPLLPGRNLQVVLEYEPLTGGIESLNATLLPHWDALWPIAASALTTQKVPQ
jgi:hypothetical protein